MADARIPEQYLTDKRVLRLTDAERSSYFMALTWSVSNRSDGRIERADLPLIPTFSSKAIPGLVRWECWRTDGKEAWIIVDYARWQTTRSEFEVLDNARRREREKKARQRAKAKDVTGDSPGGTSRGTSQARQGQARQEPGQDESEAPEDWYDPATGEVSDQVTDWPTTPIPNSGGWGSPDAPGAVLGATTSAASAAGSR
ncbi:hypothetical protein J2Y69_002768 [Microbacterium resistens]|uniref:Uncharacterized protein n=1 Tax=Microbacterium resistens TaxID=156977 RepID=A0ABU1SF21_9MICO|nr:hypothetical protein [Microbacterium resistens]MDR6868157.1 hypothetical protein [Microbacterium resistens]